MKQITKGKPYFDKKGSLYFPKDIKFGGEVKPSLNPKEWWFLILEIADKKNITKEHSEKLFNNLIGNKSNYYRIKRSLKAKGYL